jgi:cbb3-type cytochrome oxidase maturation protein
MEILYLLIPLSLVLVLIAGVVFWWMADSGQFEDLEGPAHRILMDDDRPEKDEGAATKAEVRAKAPRADAQ